MAYIVEVTDHFDRTITATDYNLGEEDETGTPAQILDSIGNTITVNLDSDEDNRGFIVNGDTTISSGNVTSINSALGNYPNDHPNPNNQGTQIPLIINGKRLRLAGQFRCETNNFHMHFFNCTIEFDNPADEGGNILGTNDGAPIADNATIGGSRIFGFHNCTFVKAENNLDRADMRWQFLTDCKWIGLGDNPHRQDHNIHNGAIINGFDYDGGNLTFDGTGSALAGFRGNGLIINGKPRIFERVSSVQAGWKFNAAANDTRLSDFFNVAAAKRHANNILTGVLDGPRGDDNGDTVQDVPTVLRMSMTDANSGVLFPAPFLDTTVQGTYYATDLSHRTSSRMLTSAPWAFRAFDSASLDTGSSGIYINGVTNVTYATGDGYGFINPPVGSDNEVDFTYITNDDGYPSGSFDYENNASDAGDEKKVIQGITHMCTFVNQTLADQGGITTGNFNALTELNRNIYRSTFEISSPRGSYSDTKEISESENYRAADADFIVDSGSAIDSIDESQIIDNPDTGVTHYTTGDIAAHFTAVKNKFPSSGDPEVTINDIGALYKIAIAEKSIDIDDFIVLDNSSTLDISTKGIKSISINDELSEEYTVDSGKFTVRATSLILEESASFNVNSIKVNEIDLDDTAVDGISIEAISGGFIANPIVAQEGTTRTTAFDNLTLKGDIALDSVQNIDIQFGSNVVYDGVTITNESAGTINVYGASSSDIGAGDTTTLAFPFVTTVNADITGDITILKEDGDYLHFENSNSEEISSIDLPEGTHFFICSDVGYHGVPQEVAIPGTSIINLTSVDLSAVGYDDTDTTIGTRTWSRETYEGREVVASNETDENDFLATPIDSVRWFGESCGASTGSGNSYENLFNEAVLDNFSISEDTRVFELDPSNSVTKVLLPIIRATHGTNVDGVLQFNADTRDAVAIETNYTFTDGLQTTIDAPGGQGVTRNAQTVGALSGTIENAHQRTVRDLALDLEDAVEAINNYTEEQTGV